MKISLERFKKIYDFAVVYITTKTSGLLYLKIISNFVSKI